MQLCPSCQKEMPNYANYCGHCGHALKLIWAFTTTMTEEREMHNGHSPSSNAQSIAVSSARPRTSTFRHKVQSVLPRPLQRAVVAVLTKARDPKPEEPLVDPQTQTIAWGWLPILALACALGMLLMAHAYTSARQGATQVEIFFWLGLLLIFAPAAARLLSPGASRFERISLLCIVGICFYIVNVLANPSYFAGHDAFVHWRTADDIARSHHLFSDNSLLPTSPFYPGLEIVTNALSSLSGLNIFISGVIVLSLARLVMVLSLFIIYERVTKSVRIAGIATILYMTNPHFLFFDAQFSYESLALPLALFVLFMLIHNEKISFQLARVGHKISIRRSSETDNKKLESERRWITFITWLPLGAVVVTHHLTDFALDGLLVLWVAVYVFQRRGRRHQLNLKITAVFAIIMSLAWISLRGNPVVEYLSSYFKAALDELGQILTGASHARQLFSVYSGQAAPLWERITAFSSVGLILLCLPFGLLCLWQRYRYRALACVFGIASLFYPLSHAFRLTSFGSEITDRAAAFLFIPIAFVLAIFIVQFWPTRWLTWRQTSLITCAISTVFLGGVILGAGPPWELLPGPYMVAADERSIEPEGIQAAAWAQTYLGPDNRLATDRINRLLMSTYGHQRIVTSLDDGIDVTPVFFSPSLSPDEVSILRHAEISYLVVDLRLSTALPSIGIYFELGEPGSFHHTKPIDPKALTKFNTISQINRVFDSGDIVIYSVGGLINAP